MQYKEFKKKAQTVTQQVWEEKFYSETPDNLSEYLITTNIDVTGGMEGGSCWGTQPRYYTNYDYAVDYKPLQDFLEAIIVKPIPIKILFTIFNLNMSDTYTDREYYGNYNECAYYKIYIKSLYELIQDYL